MKNILYIGSCRYQCGFPIHFPPRIHTTKELLYFLSGQEIDLTHPYANLLWGGCLHPDVLPATKDFIKVREVIWESVDTVVFELSSLLYYRFQALPFNYFYAGYFNIPTTEFVLNELTPEELLGDLLRVKNMLEAEGKRFAVIAPIDLPIQIEDRLVKRRQRMLFTKMIQEEISSRVQVFFPTGMILKKYPDATQNEVLPNGMHFSDEKYPILICKEIKKSFQQCLES